MFAVWNSISDCTIILERLATTHAVIPTFRACLDAEDHGENSAESSSRALALIGQQVQWQAAHVPALCATQVTDSGVAIPSTVTLQYGV